MALTSAQASQDVLNIATALQAALINGGTIVDQRKAMVDILATVIALAEVVNANASTLSSSISPTSVFIDTPYSATASTTYPIQTSNW